MRWLDCLLPSLALGSSLLTAYVFSSSPLENEAAVSDPAPFPFRCVVIHEARSCARYRPVGLPRLPCHFVITSEGEAVPTLAWKDRRPCASTSDLRINARALVVAFESGGDRARQERALGGLLREIEKREGVRLSQVLHHIQVERGGCEVDRPKR